MSSDLSADLEYIVRETELPYLQNHVIVVLWLILRFVLSLALCSFVLVFFSPFSIAITSRGKRNLTLVFFVRLFDSRLFGFVGFLFLLVSWEGLRLVNVALPELFSYLFCERTLGMTRYCDIKNHGNKVGLQIKWRLIAPCFRNLASHYHS